MPVTLADPQFVAGDQCDVVVMVGADPVILPGDKWSMTIKGMNKDMSNMRDGRFRVAGLPDAEGSFDMKYDIANDPTSAAKGNIRHGQTLDLKLYGGQAGATSPTSPVYLVKAIVDEVTVAAEFQNELTLAIKWSLKSGTVTYPTYPAPTTP